MILEVQIQNFGQNRSRNQKVRYDFRNPNPKFRSEQVKKPKLGMILEVEIRTTAHAH